MSIFASQELLLENARRLYRMGRQHSTYVKEAGDAKKTYALSGELYLSDSGWLMLKVPNALVRGLFDALSEPGVELPPSKGSNLTAHISCMRPEEISRIGGPSVLSERGHRYHFQLGPVKVVEPASWREMSKVYFVEVYSPEICAIRRSYGLSSLPNDDKFPLHLTFGVKRRTVLHDSDVVKGGEIAKAAAFLREYYDTDFRKRSGVSDSRLLASGLDDATPANTTRGRGAADQVPGEDAGSGRPATPREYRENLPRAIRKLAADKPVHGRLAAVTYDGDKRIVTCPRCDKPLEGKNLYIDAKSWHYCRKCFGHGGGALKMPAAVKQAAGGMFALSMLDDALMFNLSRWRARKKPKPVPPPVQPHQEPATAETKVAEDAADLASRAAAGAAGVGGLGAAGYMTAKGLQAATPSYLDMAVSMWRDPANLQHLAGDAATSLSAQEVKALRELATNKPRLLRKLLADKAVSGVSPELQAKLRNNTFNRTAQVRPGDLLVQAQKGVSAPMQLLTGGSFGHAAVGGNNEWFQLINSKRPRKPAEVHQFSNVDNVNFANVHLRPTTPVRGDVDILSRVKNLVNEKPKFDFRHMGTLKLRELLPELSSSSGHALSGAVERVAKSPRLRSWLPKSLQKYLLADFRLPCKGPGQTCSTAAAGLASEAGAFAGNPRMATPNHFARGVRRGTHSVASMQLPGWASSGEALKRQHWGKYGPLAMRSPLIAAAVGLGAYGLHKATAEKGEVKTAVSAKWLANRISAAIDKRPNYSAERLAQLATKVRNWSNHVAVRAAETGAGLGGQFKMSPAGHETLRAATPKPVIEPAPVRPQYNFTTKTIAPSNNYLYAVHEYGHSMQPSTGYQYRDEVLANWRARNLLKKLHEAKVPNVPKPKDLSSFVNNVQLAPYAANELANATAGELSAGPLPIRRLAAKMHFGLRQSGGDQAAYKVKLQSAKQWPELLRRGVQTVISPTVEAKQLLQRAQAAEKSLVS